MRALPGDAVYNQIECSPGVAREISEHFTFDVPGARFTPAFKRGWDGKIRLFRRGFLYAGLTDEVAEFCEERGYLFEDRSEIGSKYVDLDLDEFIASLKLPEKFQLRDYQYEAVAHCLQSERALLLSPTASGKSLIIYVVSQRFTRTLIIVPTTALVSQMVGDFRDYGYKGEIQEILGGRDRDVKAPVVIGTWQSIVKEAPEWVNQFECVIVDEAHGAKAKSLTGIMEAATHVLYRFGFTGTLDGAETNEMVLRGLFGPVRRVVSTGELVRRGTIAKPNIRVLTLVYPERQRKAARGLTYDEEIKFLTEHPARNNFIINLAASMKGNTVLLFRLLEHGKLLAAALEKLGNRKVYLVDGGVDGEIRNDVRAEVEEDENAIIVASRGTFAVGVNIKRLHNLIIAHPTKSRILVPQSVGRGLRLGSDKTECQIYDIADDLSWKKKNYTLTHALERIAIYYEQEMDPAIFRIDLEDN